MRRRKKKKYKAHKMMEADLTPMIDVTFQLIAFFMILISFSEIERAEEIMLPSSVLAKPPEETPDYTILMNLDPKGEITFAGQKIENIDQISPIFSLEISAAAREKVPVEDISVVIRSHEATPTGLVQKLIAKCQESELQSFSLRVKEELYR